MEQTIIASFIGYFFGFIFSLIIFYLKENFKTQETKNQLTVNLQRELKFNIKFLQIYKRELNELINKINLDEELENATFSYDKVRTLFIVKAFDEGFLYDPLQTKDIVEIGYMVKFFDKRSNEYANNLVKQYETNQIDKEEILESFEQELEFIEKYLKLLNEIKPKLKRL